MKQLRLYGKTPCCYWCGTKLAHDPSPVEITYGKEQYELIVCSPACEEKSRWAAKYVKQMVPLFLVGIFGGIALVAIPPLRTELLGLMVLGATLILCPFCTPQTTLMLGMKKSFALGRSAGVLFLLGAIGVRIWQGLQ